MMTEKDPVMEEIGARLQLVRKKLGMTWTLLYSGGVSDTSPPPNKGES